MTLVMSLTHNTDKVIVSSFLLYKYKQESYQFSLKAFSTTIILQLQELYVLLYVLENVRKCHTKPKSNLLFISKQ